MLVAALPVPLAVEVGPGQSGPLGLLVVVLLCLACVVLFRSMIRQLKRVPRRFDAPQGTPTPDRDPAAPVSPPDGPAGA